MKNMQVFASAVLGGALVAAFGMAELLLRGTYPLAAALLFGVMLLAVLILDLHLATAKAGYLLRYSNLIRIRAIHLLLAFGGNAVGAVAAGELLRLVHYDTISASVKAFLEQHFLAGALEVLVGAVFCGILMFIAIHPYRRSRGGVGGAFTTLGAGAAILLCGFSHSVTDLFYMAFGHIYNGRALAVVLLGMAGNLLGAVCTALIYEYKKSEDEIYREQEKAEESAERRHAHRHMHGREE